jgi:hypothetical protein
MDDTEEHEAFWLDLFKTVMPGDPRPTDFPPELPFIPDVPAKYGRSSIRLECQWLVAEDPIESPDLPTDDRAMVGRFAYLRQRAHSLTSPDGPLGGAWSFDQSQELIKSAIDSISAELAAVATEAGWVPNWNDTPEQRMRAFHTFSREGWTLHIWSLINRLSGGVQVTAEFAGLGY